MLDAIDIVTLLATPGVGPVTVRHALDAARDSTPETLHDLRDILAQVERHRPRTYVPTPAELEQGLREAERVMSRAADLGIAAIGPDNAAFPSRLLDIPDAPVILYAKGDVRCLSADLAVAVVGTREPSDFGVRSAAKLGGLFAEYGCVVVSGLAAGCDTAAHEGCVAANGPTVAVLAHGLDAIYPAANRGLAERIVASGGCLVSEYPPGQRARKTFFVERDRLQSGLSDAVVVIETDIKGGTMHTARYCRQQGRTLASVVHPPSYASHPKSNGNRHLIIEMGAFPLACKRDIDSLVSQLKSHEQSTGAEPLAATDRGDGGSGQLSLF